MLAELGYVAFCADMYGQGKSTADPKQAGAWAGHMSGEVPRWRARAMAGLNVLAGLPRTDPERLAAIGYCFGGSTVTHLAYANAPLRGVVSFHGSLPLPGEGAADPLRPEILVCHGARDSFVDDERIGRFKAALEEREADWTFIAYAGARHSFTNPGADAHGIEGVAYQRRADRRSWGHMQVFLNSLFAEQPNWE